MTLTANTWTFLIWTCGKVPVQTAAVDLLAAVEEEGVALGVLGVLGCRDLVVALGVLGALDLVVAAVQVAGQAMDQVGTQEAQMTKKAAHVPSSLVVGKVLL